LAFVRTEVIPPGGVTSLKPCSTAVVLGDDSSANSNKAGAAAAAAEESKDGKSDSKESAFVGACGGLFFALEVSS